jgi:hypothetical protein
MLWLAIQKVRKWLLAEAVFDAEYDIISFRSRVVSYTDVNLFIPQSPNPPSPL